MTITEGIKTYAFRMFSEGVSVRAVARVLDGDAGYTTVMKWRRQWGKENPKLNGDRIKQQEAA